VNFRPAGTVDVTGESEGDFTTIKYTRRPAGEH
jgi:hypothetical protein